MTGRQADSSEATMAEDGPATGGTGSLLRGVWNLRGQQSAAPLAAIWRAESHVHTMRRLGMYSSRHLP